MTAKELMKKYSMSEHPENGAFVENHYENDSANRASSGSIYYYVAPGERTAFHKIDCDEYWCYVCGAPLDLCCIDEDGLVSFARLGIENNSSSLASAPMHYFKKGTIFASKNTLPQRKIATYVDDGTPDTMLPSEPDGTFIICITVPRFTYEGFEMFSDEEILATYPDVKSFFDVDGNF